MSGTRIRRPGCTETGALIRDERAEPLPDLLLDTTVLIDVLRGRAAGDRLRRILATGPVPFVCAINIEELWRGARVDEERAVATLIQGLRVVPLGAEEGERAGRWRRDFAALGITLGQSDCLVAAAALSIGANVATANVNDFPMREVVVEDWSAR